jgi:hypothetical protein
MKRPKKKKKKKRKKAQRCVLRNKNANGNEPNYVVLTMLKYPIFQRQPG